MTRTLSMTNPWYSWSALPYRPELRWPRGARLAVCVLVSLEQLEYLPPPGSVVAPSTRHSGPYPRVFDPHLVSLHEYGNRVGVFRVLDVLDRVGVAVTVAIDAQVCESIPRLVQACVERDFELAAHGIALSRMVTGEMSEAEEQAYIAASLDALERAGGTRPVGWIGVEYGESGRTVELLAEAGIRYVCDWPNDDQPYTMTTAAGEVVALPVTLDTDDVYTCKLRAQSAETWERTICDAADTLHEEGGRLLVVHVHPWVTGQPFRIRRLEHALRHLLELGNVWMATGQEIVDYWLSTHQAARSSGTERCP